MKNRFQSLPFKFQPAALHRGARRVQHDDELRADEAVRDVRHAWERRGEGVRHDGGGGRGTSWR